MALGSLVVGDIIKFRVDCRLVANEDTTWSCGFALEVGTPFPSTVEVSALAVYLSDFVRDLLTPSRAVFNVHIYDNVPGVGNDRPPSQFRNMLGSSGPGRRSVGGDALPLGICLKLHRETASGNPGLLNVRGCLTENDVTGLSGSLDLATGAAGLLQEIVDQNWIDGNGDLYGYCGRPAGETRWVVESEKYAPRPVVDYRVFKAGFLKYEHRWFNRKAPTTSP